MVRTLTPSPRPGTALPAEAGPACMRMRSAAETHRTGSAVPASSRGSAVLPAFYCLFTLLIASTAALFAQPASQEAQIRAPVWVYAEPVPGFQDGADTAGSAEPADGSAAAPIQELNELSRFVLAGMVFGWKYEYQPSDRLRAVAEEFSLSPIGTIEAADPSFTLTGLTAEYPRITCWANYVPNEITARWQRHWEGITVKSGYGIGRGERQDGTAGIKAAYEAALLNAVRERARKLEKNKPKEIRGEVLLRANPRLYADAGQFVADIRVVLSIDELIPWSSF